MNKPAPATGFQAVEPSYDNDAYGWAMHQSALIRAGERMNLDWDNIADEIDSVGQSEYRSVESALRLVLMHMLKWRYQPERRSRSWQNSHRVHLQRFDRFMARNPGMKPELPQMLADAYGDARFEASSETDLPLETFPEAPPSWDEIRAPLEP